MKRVLRHLRTGRTAGLLLVISALLLNVEVHAAGSYLQDLEAEAAATDNTAQPVAPVAKPSWSQQQTTVSEKIEPGLSKGQFEESLKKRFYGSYLFYSTLNDKKQQVVYQEYQNITKSNTCVK